MGTPSPHVRQLSAQKSMVSMRARKSAGYNLLELLVGLIVMLILLAMALPTVSRAWRSYQLTSAASQVLGMIKSTRSDAVRTNTKVRCLFPQTNGIWWVGEDVNGNGVLDPSEPQVPLTGGPTLLAAGVAPGPSSMGYSNVPVQVPVGSIGFDARGGVDYGGGAPAVYVLYIGMENDPASGFRAISIVPAGSTQIWTAASGGTWRSLT